MSSQAYIYPILQNSCKDAIRRSLSYGSTEGKDNIKAFIDFICQEKQVKPSEFFSKNRKRNLTECRQWVCYYFTLYCDQRFLPKMPLTKIGFAIGGKDHATVLHSIKAIQNIIDTDQKKADEYNSLYLKYTQQ
jgi:chromosomal replication initiation ATPase DnaA